MEELGTDHPPGEKVRDAEEEKGEELGMNDHRREKKRFVGLWNSKKLFTPWRES